ncbi:hypothetical protein HGRIS_002200 [Hohenbuehelia grisea]|uniref:Smr domain-containing protein n=1 Tax=Hohenbuehelia grisea TaxID=104357 RepID=A0ABR3JL02_9AGAR
MGLFGILKSLYHSLCAPAQSEKPEVTHGQQPSQVPHQPQPQVQQPQPHYPPSTQQPHRPPQQQTPAKPQPGRKHEDQNQINQSNAEYMGLRASAKEEGDRMARCFEESKEAYNRGDGARAKELSNEGKQHKQKMEDINKQASEWIFIENNKDSKPGEVDLHGLYVKEAITYTDRAIQEAKQRGDSEIHLIVGKGLHSQGGAAKIKPAIEELMQKHQLTAAMDPTNAGVLIVQLNAPKSRGVGSEEIVRRLERDDEGCVIM